MSNRDAGSTIDPENYDAAEDLDQLQADDSQTGGEDPLETGYSPPERPIGMREEITLDQRLAEGAGVESVVGRFRGRVARAHIRPRSP